MTTRSPYTSLAAAGDRLGGLIAGHIDLAFRRLLRGPGVDIDRGYVRLVTGEAHPFGNFVLMSDPAEAGSVRAVIEPLLRCGAPSAVLFTGSVPGAAAECLRAAGYEPHPGMPAMGVEIEKLAATSLPAGYTLSRVGGGAEESGWAEAFADGYELPRKVGACFGPGAAASDDPELRYYAIMKDGRPVCTSLVYLREGVAGIYGVATLPAERGKGLGAHVTAEPLRLAHALGYRVGVLQASEAGHPIYKRLGFEDFGEVAMFIRMPG